MAFLEESRKALLPQWRSSRGTGKKMWKEVTNLEESKNQCGVQKFSLAISCSVKFWMGISLNLFKVGVTAALDNKFVPSEGGPIDGIVGKAVEYRWWKGWSKRNRWWWLSSLRTLVVHHEISISTRWHRGWRHEANIREIHVCSASKENGTCKRPANGWPSGFASQIVT